MQPTGDDHRTAGQKYRPVARAAPEHQPVPARRSFIRKQRLAHLRMNAVGADQDIAAHGLDVAARAIEEIGGDAALVLGEGAKPTSRVDGALPQPLLDGVVDYALQPAAMDRELRHVV